MLYDKLNKYSLSDVYPMHMPGHKRNMALTPPNFPYDIDITEIHGFDDLRFLNGELGETADLAAKLYSSKRAFLLVNGSTVGILAGIGAHVKRGDKILFAKSCHRSVHNAVSLFDLRAVYLKPEIDKKSGVECSITPEMIKNALDNDSDIKLIVITSPSYEGVISDIRAISEIAQNRGKLLLVDSAHGAHLGLSNKFPENATRCGADIVVMSLHKTLPALTQCSLLHVCSNNADVDELNRLLFVLQTSSPSYVLMSSTDYCLRLLDGDSEKLFNEYDINLSRFFDSVSDLKSLSVINPKGFNFNAEYPGFFDFDPGKIIIVTKNTNLIGATLADILRTEYKIELEASHPQYAIAMSSICDTSDGFNRLSAALKAIDRRI